MPSEDPCSDLHGAIFMHPDTVTGRLSPVSSHIHEGSTTFSSPAFNTLSSSGMEWQSLSFKGHCRLHHRRCHRTWTRHGKPNWCATLTLPTGDEVTAAHRTTANSACAHTGSLYLKTGTQEKEMIPKPVEEWIVKIEAEVIGPQGSKE